jgi:hypothetical protein
MTPFVRKFLMAEVAAVSLIAAAGVANATDDAGAPNATIEEVSIGWVKNADITCDHKNICDLHNSYVKGNCGNFAIPVYSGPNRKPIGELASEVVAGFGVTLVQRETRSGYSHIYLGLGSGGSVKDILGNYDASYFDTRHPPACG